LNPDISVITDFEMDDVELENYECHDTIKAPMAV
jgi:thymidylate synthase